MDQRALVLNAPKTPLSLERRPIPEPKEDQLLIKVTAASLNPHDAKIRDIGFFFDGTPLVLTNDIAGEVIKIGPGSAAAQYAIGEHVFAQSTVTGGKLSPDKGGLQEYAIVDTKDAAKVAETGLTDDQVVTFPTNMVVVWLAFFHPSGFGFPPPYGSEAESIGLASKTLLVIGGGSQTGRLAVQVAKWLGFARIVAVAAKSNEAELTQLGASHVVDRHADDWIEQIRGIVGDELEYAIDTVNYGRAQLPGAAALSNSKHGILVTLLPMESNDSTVGEIGAKTAGYERRFIAGSSVFHGDFAAEFWKRLPGWIRNGYIKPGRSEVIEGLDAGKVNEALDRYTHSKPTAKVIVHP